MKKIDVAKHLTDSEYNLLMKVYTNHNRSMGLKDRKNYTLSEIVKVERNLKEKCLNVHYRDGEWWHYLPNGSWY